MPDFLPQILGLPFVLMVVVVVAGTLLGLRHVRPAAGVAFLVVVVTGWGAARALSRSVGGEGGGGTGGLGGTGEGLAVLPAAFSALMVYVVVFAVAWGVIWAVQTVRVRRLKAVRTKRELGEWEPTSSEGPKF